MKKLLAILIAGSILFLPVLGFTQQVPRTLPQLVTVNVTAAAANSAVTATLAAPTDGTRLYLVCYVIQTISAGAPTAATFNVTTTGLVGAQLTLPVALTAATVTVLTPYNTCANSYPTVIPASATNTAIVFTGNSVDAAATLRITLYGYKGL
jgi:hypothetical protein